jgi:hypothetical protein
MKVFFVFFIFKKENEKDTIMTKSIPALALEGEKNINIIPRPLNQLSKAGIDDSIQLQKKAIKKAEKKEQRDLKLRDFEILEKMSSIELETVELFHIKKLYMLIPRVKKTF